MRRLLARLGANFEEWLLGATFMFMAFMTFAQVVSRYCLHRSISFTEELVRYLLIWCTMLGIAAAAKRRSHIGVHFATLVAPKARVAFVVFGGLCTCAFFLILAVYGASMVWCEHRLQTTAALNWPMWWVGISIPLGGALAIVRTVQACWVLVRSREPKQGGA